MKKKYSLLLSSLFLSSILTVGLVSCDKPKEPNTENHEDGNNQEGDDTEQGGGGEGTPDSGNSEQGGGDEGTPDSGDTTLELSTIADARNVLTGTKVKIQGVITKFYYLENMKVSGYLLTDDTASVLVNDVNIDGNLSEGNKITLEGTKTDETSQLLIKDVKVIENDNGSHKLDGSKVTSLSVSECLTNNSNDISLTGNIYKATAKITSKSGNGEGGPWTSYKLEDPEGNGYLNVYSQNSGQEFTWLDEYIGTSQLVYYSVINYKKGSSTYYPRVLPIHVGFLEGDKLEDKDVPNYLMDKYISNQFKLSYDTNPEKELVTSISEAENNISGASVTYTSINENVATIDDTNGKKVLNIIDQGEGSIKVTVTYKEQFTSTRTYEFTSYIIKGTLNTKTIKEALDAPYCDEGEDPFKETLISLKGTIYASGDAIRNTFYVGDSTGVILIDAEAVKEDLPTLHIGDEVKIEGWKRRFGEKENFCFGTTLVEVNILEVIKEATLSSTEVTLDKTSYVTDKTLEDIEKFVIDPTVDHTKQIYTINAKLVGNELVYKPSENLVSKVVVYTKDISKYDWAKTEEEVTMDIAFININDKDTYSASILAVYSNNTVKRNIANLTEIVA